MTKNKNAILFLEAPLGLLAGCFIGIGNHAGLVGAIVPGLILGAIMALFCVRKRDWTKAGALAVCALVGSVIATTLPENGSVKHFCMSQSNLYVHVGSYQLGTDPDPK